MTLTVLPAVDVSGGQAVRLVQGAAGTETSYGDPLQAALAWQAAGAEWIHLVDLDQPYRLAARHVHRGQQRQAHRSVSSQLASNAAPASPDFSGWNWVAHSGPFSAAATNGSPWVAQVTSGRVM